MSDLAQGEDLIRRIERIEAQIAEFEVERSAAVDASKQLSETLQTVIGVYIDIQRVRLAERAELGSLRTYLHIHQQRGWLRRLWDWLWVPAGPTA